MYYKKLNLFAYVYMVTTLLSSVEASDSREDSDSSHNHKRSRESSEENFKLTKKFKTDDSADESLSEKLIAELQEASHHFLDAPRRFSHKALETLENFVYKNLNVDEKDFILAKILCQRNTSSEAKGILEKLNNNPALSELIDQYYEIAKLHVFGTGIGGADHLIAFKFYKKVINNKDLISSDKLIESYLRLGYIWGLEDNLRGGVNREKANKYRLKVAEHPAASIDQKETAYERIAQSYLIVPYNFDKYEESLASLRRFFPESPAIAKLEIKNGEINPQERENEARLRAMLHPTGHIQ